MMQAHPTGIVLVWDFLEVISRLTLWGHEFPSITSLPFSSHGTRPAPVLWDLMQILRQSITNSGMKNKSRCKWQENGVGLIFFPGILWDEFIILRQGVIVYLRSITMGVASRNWCEHLRFARWSWTEAQLYKSLSPQIRFTWPMDPIPISVQSHETWPDMDQPFHFEYSVLLNQIEVPCVSLQVMSQLAFSFPSPTCPLSHNIIDLEIPSLLTY